METHQKAVSRISKMVMTIIKDSDMKNMNISMDVNIRRESQYQYGCQILRAESCMARK
jgi:hypothetical protein